MSADNPNRGFHIDRTKHDPKGLEACLAKAWEEECSPPSWLNGGISTLDLLCSDVVPDSSGRMCLTFPTRKRLVEIDDSHRKVAATVIQWLGSNCGFCFLSDALKAAGYKIVRTKDKT